MLMVTVHQLIHLTSILVCLCGRFSKVAALSKERTVTAKTIVDTLMDNCIFGGSTGAMEKEAFIQFRQ